MHLIETSQNAVSTRRDVVIDCDLQTRSLRMDRQFSLEPFGPVLSKCRPLQVIDIDQLG